MDHLWLMSMAPPAGRPRSSTPAVTGHDDRGSTPAWSMLRFSRSLREGSRVCAPATCPVASIVMRTFVMPVTPSRSATCGHTGLHCLLPASMPTPWKTRRGCLPVERAAAGSG